VSLSNRRYELPTAKPWYRPRLWLAGRSRPSTATDSTISTV